MARTGGQGMALGRDGEIGREGERERERERETTAAVVAYGLDKKGRGERSVLLVDGGFFELSTRCLNASWWTVDWCMARIGEHGMP